MVGLGVYSFLKLILFYKMRNGICSEYLSSLVTPKIGNNTVFYLRNASDYKIIISYIHLYYNSFLPSVVRDWNELSQDTENATSICAFKHRLNSTMIDVPFYYHNGKRTGQTYNAILKTDCSSLNHHLYSKNIDTPLCICGILKLSIISCLIAKRSMSFARKWCKKYRSPLCEPTLDTHLYGNRALSGESNEHHFIYQST